MMQDTRPNVLLIVSEDHGPHLGCYGDPNARTPTLDRLAAEGVRFANHHTTCAICSPGRASILTGLYPHQNGQINLTTHNYAMYRPFTNLSSILKAQGYRTARLGKLHVLPEEAFAFDFVWNERERWSFRQRDVHRAAEVAGEFAADGGDEPLFVYACPPDAHLPELHESFGEPANPQGAEDIELPDFCPVDAPHIRDRVAAYYNCLERLDTGVRLMIEQLQAKSDRETIVIFTTDHGQQFIRGKVTCYEGGLRVPLIVHAPGRMQGGQVREALTSHVDVLPTILEMLEVNAPEALPGRSLLPLAQDRDAAWREHVVGQWTGSPRMWYPQRSIRDGRYKLIVNYLPDRENPGATAYLPPGLWETSLDADDLAAVPADLRAALERAVRPPREELYDLQHDPTELHDLAGRAELADVQAGLRAALERWQAEHGDRIAEPEVLTALTEMHEHVEREHYPDSIRPKRREDITWDYARWIDPGVTV